jgi:CRISPR-associated exonuclease Cas4
MAHELNASQDNTFLEIGRLLSQETYKRERKEITVGNLKMDILKKGKDGRMIVGEIKKSSRFQKSAINQLSFYLYRLKKMGIQATGELLIPKEKRRITVILDEDREKELKKAFFSIEKIIEQEKPPEAIKIRFCRNCAYQEFCWA